MAPQRTREVIRASWQGHAVSELAEEQSCSQIYAIHEMACLEGDEMFQEAIPAEHSTLAPPGADQLGQLSLRERVTATLIREEAAESLLADIQGDVELAALARVLNRYQAAWWLKHLSRVGADPATYWRAQLGEEIKAVTRGKPSPSLSKKGPRWGLGWFTPKVKYELCDLDLDPL